MHVFTESVRGYRCRGKTARGEIQGQVTAIRHGRGRDAGSSRRIRAPELKDGVPDGIWQCRREWNQQVRLNVTPGQEDHRAVGDGSSRFPPGYSSATAGQTVRWP